MLSLVVVWLRSIYPYSLGFLQYLRGTIAPLARKHLWGMDIWVKRTPYKLVIWWILLLSRDNTLKWTILVLNHWGRVTHTCVSKLTNIGSDNGLSPGRRQAIIWTNAGILLIGPLGTIFSEILIEIRPFSFKKMHLKMSSGKWRPFCLGFNVLRQYIFSSVIQVLQVHNR